MDDQEMRPLWCKESCWDCGEEGYATRTITRPKSEPYYCVECEIHRRYKKQIEELERKLKEKPKDINLGLYELMDRSFCMFDHFGEVIADHQVLEDYPALGKHVKAAQDALYTLYQAAGSKWHDETKDIDGMWSRGHDETK